MMLGGGAKLDGERGAGALSSRGYRIIAAVVIVAFLALGARLWYLQVLRGDHYYRKSADNFVKEVSLPATRGRILDRDGRVLVDNRPSYNVYLTPRFLTDEALAALARHLHLDAEQTQALSAKVAAKKGLERFRQLLAFEDVTRDQMAVLESHKQELPGVAVDAQPHRDYPHGKLAAHLLGYMNQIGADELQRMHEQGYRLGDYLGRSGIERQWEPYLRGKDGFERIFVDAKGHTKGDVDSDEIATFAQMYGGPRRQDPQPGDDVVLTIDLDLQRVVEKALSRHRSAAAAVVEVKTGRVLALASWPEFDPNVLTGHLSRAEDERLQKDPYRPLTDKAVRENFFPGSTFKIFPALAALDDKQITPDEKMICHGAYRMPGHTFHCMEVHGPIDLHRSIVESCDVYFYHLGERIGLDRMAQVARDFGLGSPTGIGLAGEAPGFIADMDYYKREGGFKIGYALNTAIGQGSTKVTVLQLAYAYAAIADEGRLYVPTLVDRIVAPSGQVVQSFAPRLRRQAAVSRENLERVKSALCGVVNEPKGTVFASRDPGLEVEVCGKTGTAQMQKNRHGESAGWDLGNSHAWFASYAPAKDPEIAVVVLVEHGGIGGHVAAPTAFAIYQAYFAQKIAKANASANGNANGNGSGSDSDSDSDSRSDSGPALTGVHQ